MSWTNQPKLPSIFPDLSPRVIAGEWANLEVSLEQRGTPWTCGGACQAETTCVISPALLCLLALVILWMDGHTPEAVQDGQRSTPETVPSESLHMEPLGRSSRGGRVTQAGCIIPGGAVLVEERRVFHSEERTL